MTNTLREKILLGALSLTAVTTGALTLAASNIYSGPEKTSYKIAAFGIAVAGTVGPAIIQTLRGRKKYCEKSSEEKRGFEKMTSRQHYQDN